MPLHPIGLAFYATIIVFFLVLFTIGFARSVKMLRIIGYGGGALILLGGGAFSAMLYFLHVGMSGDPNDLSPLIPLIPTIAVAIVFFAITWVRIRQRRRHTPGHCKQCNYDLRVNRAAENCPECGFPINRVESD